MRLFWPALLMMATSCGLADDGTMPVVSGTFGSKPVIAIPSGRPGRTPSVTVLSVGAGRRTVPGDVVLADVEIRQWTGNKPYLTTYDAHQPTTVVFDGRHVSATWREALIGRAAGSRVMLVSPAGEAQGPNIPLTGIRPADTLVLVFDILGGYPADARLFGRTLPSIPGDLDLTSEPRTVIDGSGPPVKAGGKVVVQYVAAEWPSRRVVDSSYRRGGPSAFTLERGAVPSGWVEGLTGRRVGCRVALPSPDERKPMLYVVDVIDSIGL
ncbi:FKBP-type peptidyl-prolyl cis-trans isomerase [Nonomuraea sp. NPDC000554]|uniref:FKBP-type peptidyl-prolyl cis-trans isomerase n=1 Tax=Nonomuraea sp. NPDC000554 TaxID=3154259 RepID=UPI003327C3B5